jgi:N-methylhydantoinase B
MTQHRVNTDPYTLEVIKNALVAIGEEMFVTMQRTSMSPIIYEALDFSVGLTDDTANLIAQGQGTTVLLAMIDSFVRDILAKYGREGVHRGDVFIGNDPYRGGGTHLSDVGVATPIFHENELIAFAVSKAHWLDVGGAVPGSFSTNATEIFQEGLQIPICRIIERGERRTDILEIIASNIRVPHESIGDLWAAVAANGVAERRLQELFTKYGREAIDAAKNELLDYSEAMALEELRSLPKGVFVAEDYIDDDGRGSEPLRVVVKVTIDDDRFVADFTGSAPQVLGPINNSRTGLEAGVRLIFKALTGPHIPANSGTFRPIQVICPDKTLFTAERPAPVSTYWETEMYAVDLIWRALAPHVPHRLPAGHMLSVCAVILAGTHADTGKLALCVQPLVGGWGAGVAQDGQSGQFAAADGETYNIPVEIAEARYGFLVEEYGFHDEDGGHGEFRGGKGVKLACRMRSDDFTLTGSFGRCKFPPWGINGGGEGTPNYMKIVRHDGTTQTLGKVTGLALRRGDVVEMITATGGGWGDPRRRARERVMADIRNGFITASQAEAYYTHSRTR